MDKACGTRQRKSRLFECQILRSHVRLRMGTAEEFNRFKKRSDEFNRVKKRSDEFSRFKTVFLSDMLQQNCGGIMEDP